MGAKTLERKPKRYGRSRARRRRGGFAALLFIGLVLSFPLLVEGPRTVRDEVHLRMYPLAYADVIREAAAEYDVEPTLVAAVIHTESRFRPASESPQGAYGLMQILPQTAPFIQEKSGIRGDYREPEINIRMGTWYLGYLGDRYQGDVTYVLAAYNSGEGQVDSWIRDGYDLDVDIPFRETRSYVTDVNDTQQVYKELYGRNLDRNSR